MKFADGVFLAAVQMARRRMRAFLCAVSVGVGVLSMVLIASLGLFGERQLQQGMESVGLSGLTVYVSQAGQGQLLTAKHASALAATLPEVAAAMPVKVKSGTYRTSHQNGSAVFLGVNEHLGDVMGLSLVAGRLPNAQEVKYGRAVAVIDEVLAKKLYQRTNITGKSVRFTVEGKEEYFEIIGVIKSQTGAIGASFGNLIPTPIYVPYSCLASDKESVDQIFIQCAAKADLDDTGTQVKDFLSHREQVAGTLSVQNVSGAVEQIQGMAWMVTALFLAVGAISFFVAMLGVLSGMFSATHEKTAEIGIFMALGAQRKDIARIFLLQAVLTCLLGGVGGTVLAGVLLAAASQVLGVTLSIPFGFAAAVLALSALCGALSGVFPAIRAAKLHPVDAMRK